MYFVDDIDAAEIDVAAPDVEAVVTFALEEVYFDGSDVEDCELGVEEVAREELQSETQAEAEVFRLQIGILEAGPWLEDASADHFAVAHEEVHQEFETLWATSPGL